MKNLVVEKTETLQPEIDKMIEGAKQAVQYFEWLIQANQATGEIIKSQLEFAQNELQKLKDEKAKKFRQD